MTDDKVFVGTLRKKVAEFVSARKWEIYHTPKNLSMSISIEANELLEHFQWLTHVEADEYLDNQDNSNAVADELADVIIYCLSFANRTKIDISNAVLKKLSINENRFPLSNFKNE